MQANYYTFLALLLLGFFFAYFNIDTLGFVFILLAIIVLFYNIYKKPAKSAWKELDAAKGSYPEGKFEKYAELSAKKFAEWGDDTFTHTFKQSDRAKQYNTRDAVQKLHPASKNFFAELKDLFK